MHMTRALFFFLLDDFTDDCDGSDDGNSVYVGNVNVTVTGLPCQRWDSQVPHAHPYNSPAYMYAFPEGSATAAGNKCRCGASSRENLCALFNC